MIQVPVYIDNHATTRCDPRVLQAMLPYFSERYGNASSISHQFGDDARDAVERAREQIAATVNAPQRSVVFTSGATEANNLAIKGLIAPRLRSGEPVHLITNAAEHRAVLDPAGRLKRAGAQVTVLPVDQHGHVDPQSVADAIRPNTTLVSIMLANNEIGTINPIEEIAAVCRERDVPLHCDAVQGLGRIAVDFENSGCDLLSITAHKLYGPKGVGALIVRRGRGRLLLEPLLDGGGHENQLRSGTLPVPLIVGFGEACRIASDCQQADADRIASLRDRLWNRLQSELDGLHLNGHTTRRLPGNLNVSFDGVDGDALMNCVTDIAVSSGSACTSADPEPSHVLRAIGRSDSLTRASLRFGIGRFNTEDEIDFAVDHVACVVKELRAPSITSP
jgi:cysteine desulfurase